jgi:hypothetical protein
MIDIYRPKDGDIVKIIPILNKDWTFQYNKITSFIYLTNEKKMIYDDLNYLRRVWSLERKKGISGKTSGIGDKHWFSVYIDGVIKFMAVGRSLSNVIINSFKDNDLINNKYLLVKSVDRSGFPDFSESTIIEGEFIFENVNNKQDLIEWTLRNQKVYLKDYLDSNGVFSNLALLNKEYDNVFSDLISKDRDKKLEELGI